MSDYTKVKASGTRRRWKTGRKKNKTLKAVVYGLKRKLKPEYKVVRVNTNNVFSNTGHVTHISAVGTGDYNYQRNGLQIRPTSIYIRGSINMDTTIDFCTARLILVRDNQVNGTGDPALGDLLEIPAAVYYAPYSMPRIENRRRFEILHSQLMCFNKASNTSMPVKIYKKLNQNKAVNFNGSLSYDKGTGHLFLMLISDEDTYPPLITCISQMTYTDI